MTFAAPVTVA